MTTVTDLIDDLEALSGRLDSAHEMTRGGAVVDLTGLSEQVGRICGEVERLAGTGEKPPAIAQALEGVLERMDRLESLMKSEQANMAGSVDGISHHKRAVTAYGKAPPSTQPQKPPRR